MSLKDNKFILPAALLVVAAALVFHGVSSVGALTDTIVSKAIQLNHVRVNFADVVAVPNVADPGGTCGGMAKRVVVYTVPAGGLMNSIVTKARNVFGGPGIDQVGVIAVRAEQAGVQLSSGDIAVPNGDLKNINVIENRIPTGGEYAFYDEAAPWDVVAYFCGQDVNSANKDISGLLRGNVDFYISASR